LFFLQAYCLLASCGGALWCGDSDSFLVMWDKLK